MSLASKILGKVVDFVFGDRVVAFSLMSAGTGVAATAPNIATKIVTIFILQYMLCFFLGLLACLLVF